MARRDEGRAFGRKPTEHLLILASGDKVRHMTIRPWMAALGVCLVAVFAIGYLVATSYLIIRDDLIGATIARQARMQHDYEDRIAALRAQLDRVTSRQLMDQQVVEKKVEKLLEQQSALFSRHGKFSTLIDRAEESGLTSPVSTTRTADQGRQASLGGGLDAIHGILGGKRAGSQMQSEGLAYAPQENMSDRADRIFSNVTLSLRDIEQEQMARISDLTADADQSAAAISDIIRKTGIDVDATAGEERATADGMGGPFVEPETSSSPFDASLDGLDTALNRLESVREAARALPYASPAPGRRVTSRYGNRIDPFLGRLALHAGIDFQADTGAKVLSTGGGKVVSAGYSGGYGNMVEIDHGYGMTTRYGHLSRLLVSKGDVIEPGDVVGRAGSTGRSTGPHIHYEVRRNGAAINPLHFLNAGTKLTAYLD